MVGGGVLHTSGSARCKSKKKIQMQKEKKNGWLHVLRSVTLIETDVHETVYVYAVPSIGGQQLAVP